jgi:hypothetical protein
MNEFDLSCPRIGKILALGQLGDKKIKDSTRGIKAKLKIQVSVRWQSFEEVVS